MTLPSEPSYLIADLKMLLKERAKIDLSPVELAEILWLALQRGGIPSDREQSRQIPVSATKSDVETSLPSVEPSEAQEKPSTAAVVAEPPSPTGESKQDTEDRTAGTALPVSVPEAVALRNRQQIARSLRPLKRKVPSKLRQVFDEEATAIASAEAQTWRPVEKPEPERWLELAIVIEMTNLLDVWQDTISEFQQLMERHGAFRDVRTWHLKPTADGKPQLFLQTAAGLKGSARNPKELLDASGRRLILLVSDCTSRAWRSGKIPKLLELWSRENPVTIVQMLPEHYWERSALKMGHPVALRSRLPGALSRDWLIEGLSPRQRRRLPGGLKLPVVTIQPEPLEKWARAIAAISEQQTIGVVLDPQAFQSIDVGSASAPLTAKQLIQRFRKTASDSAQELVDRMAVLPVNWSVIRLIQKNWVPQTADPWRESTALSLAEIFLSGLLCPVTIDSEQSRNYKIRQQYDFVDGVRDVLLGTIPISEAQAVGEEIAEAVFKQLPAEVQERVGADIERRFGGSLNYFEAFLISDLPWGENAAAEVFPFAQVTGQVLRRWGGDYAALAEELERQETSNQQQEERYLDETAVYAALEQQLDYLQWKIVDTFVLQEHQFQVHFPGLRPKEIAAEPEPEEITLVEGEETSVEILERTIIEISEDQASFELEVRIRFAVELSYFDTNAYYSELNNHPTYEETAHNQTVDAVAEVILQFLEDENEVEPELVELRIEQPILVNPFLAEATIAFETPSPALPLQSLEDFDYFTPVLSFQDDRENDIGLTSEVKTVEVATITISTSISDSISEAQAYSALEQNLAEIKQRIIEDFEERDLDFQVNKHPRDIEDIDESQISVSRDYETSVEILNTELEGIEENVATFWLVIKISFTAEIGSLDHEAYIPEIHDGDVPHTTLEWTGQTVDGRVQVYLSFSEEDATDVEITDVELDLDSPVQLREPDRLTPVETVSTEELELFEIHIKTVEKVEGEWVALSATSAAYCYIEPLSQRIDLEMVAIPSGEFQMGSPDDELERYGDESPQHLVTVSSFFMGRYPVTQAQWRVVAALPREMRDLEPDPACFKGDDRPVERVSWDDAVEFCARLSRHTGREYRLPSEAEWEYACRAETTTPFHFGKMITTEVANYDGSAYAGGPEGENREETTPVNEFGIANAFGLSDMHGNVWEWCLDHWHDSYKGAPTDGSAWLSEDDRASRVRRGGSWNANPWRCRSAYRYRSTPVNSYLNIGFRVVVAPRGLH